jgi:GMP reductase
MKALKYSDICLVPEFGTCSSRSECSTAIKLGKHSFKLPIVPSNMKSVISQPHCRWLSANDYFYIMHRFDIDIPQFIDKANRENWKSISISLGVKHEDRELINNIKSWGSRIDFLTIDIAHGYSCLMQEMLSHVREKLGHDVFIIAGNVCTPEGVAALSSWGADAVKVGIGQGSPCTTKDKTGFTIPMFTSVLKCGNTYASQSAFTANNRVPIIADGGITCNGDIAKALVAGADMVMAGGLFACCADSPAVGIMIDGTVHHAYFGSASFENKKTHSHIEGKLSHVPTCGMTIEDKLIEISEDLKSAISYAGGRDLNAFKRTKYLLV